MKFIVILFLLFTSIYTLAQQSDSQLAYTYYQAKEYDKAAEKFLKLYERTHSANFLDYYIICLINGKEYDKAEDTLKKLLKTDDSNKDFLIAQLYSRIFLNLLARLMIAVFCGIIFLIAFP